MNTSLSGVYRIVNIINQKFYIGSTKNFDHRWNKEHKPQLNKNCHYNPHLQRAWIKHGEKNFKFEVLEECDPDQCLIREQYYLDTLMPWNYEIGYNLSKVSGGGDKVSYHPNLEGIKKKHSINGKERWNKKTEKDRIAYSNKMKGDGNPNWRGGSSIGNCLDCGKQILPTNKRCMICSKIGENNPFYGKTHDEKTKQKLSIIHTGRKLSDDIKTKCKKASIDFYKSESGEQYKKELSEKMSGKNHPLYGIGHTSETIEKMKRLAIERSKSQTIEYKISKKCKLNHSILRFKDKYYLSYAFMSKDLLQDMTTLRFKCRHESKKWSEYEEIRLNVDVPKETVEFYIVKLKENPINIC